MRVAFKICKKGLLALLSIQNVGVVVKCHKKLCKREIKQFCSQNLVICRLLVPINYLPNYLQTDLTIESTYFFLQLADGSKFKRSQSWRKILKKKDRKDKMDKVKEKEEGKLDGANSGSDSSISQTSTTSSASIGGKRANGKSTGMHTEIV